MQDRFGSLDRVGSDYERRRIRRSRAAASTMVAAASLLLVCLLSLAVAACGSDGEASGAAANGQAAGGGGAETVVITDDAGRQLTVAADVKKVFCTGPTGTSLVYTVAPELLVGWNITPTDQEKEYIPAECRDIVGLGGWFGKNTTGNVEEIIKLSPDVVLSIGTIDEGAISDAERAQGLLGVPVVMIDSTLTKTGDAYRFVGEIVGMEERADELARYSDEVIAEAQANTVKLSEEDRVTLYYAEGGKGLHTDPEGSSHTEVFTVMGARNVADVELQQGYGMSPVSLEQVIAWDPQVILVASDPAGETNVYEQITTGADWATIEAVETSQVYAIPHGPFDWVDRPYSIGRILGIPWVGNLLYPDLYDFDLQARVKDFYRLFYHLDLTDEQLQELMEHAIPVR
ncbi:MAG: ABC transporter substrate-binding protein [Actinobacteria bacterium]|nr:ABC transporter substrate-binding protein [Actinomycetota bacterium]